MCELVHERRPQRRRQIGSCYSSQPAAVGTGIVGELGVKFPQGMECAFTQRFPRGFHYGEPILIRASDDGADRKDHAGCVMTGQSLQISQGHAVWRIGQQRRQAVSSEHLLDCIEITQALL